MASLATILKESGAESVDRNGEEVIEVSKAEGRADHGFFASNTQLRNSDLDAKPPHLLVPKSHPRQGPLES
jgi:hypothetical protein